VHWKNRLLLVGLGLIDFEGLTGFLIFLLILTALLAWAIYKLALLLLPAFLLSVAVLAVGALLFHWCSRLTVIARTERRMRRTLEQLHVLEQVQAPRTEILPLEDEVRAAAQVRADYLYEQLRRWERRPKEQHRANALRGELKELRLAYDVVPSGDRWSRIWRLHQQRDWLRWLCDHPGAARYCLLGSLAVLTFAFVGILPR